jgi:membrane protein implicated in regulation of membrane protease activity
MTGAAIPPEGEKDMSRHMWFGIGGIIIGLILFAVLPWWVPVLVILAAIAIPVIGWRSLDSSQRRRIINMRRRGQLGR